MSIKLFGETNRVYLLKHHNEAVRFHSSSGGAFSAFVEVVLEQNGKIFASRYDSEMNLVNVMLDTKNDFNMMRGSKYVQGTTYESYIKIIELLKEENRVLYVGTPCQVDALKSICFQKEMKIDNLYLVDLICHGVESPMIEKEIFRIIEKNHPLKDFKYRTKKRGWHSLKPAAFSENFEEITIDKWLEYAIVILFGNYYTYREACTKCPYCGAKRYSDLTIGDAWGIEKVDPEKDDNKGISLVMVNSLKGAELLEQCRNICEIFEYSYEQFKQPRISGNPTPRPVDKDIFWNYYYSKGFIPTIKKYAGYGMKGRMIYYAKTACRNVGLTKIIKGLLYKDDK